MSHLSIPHEVAERIGYYVYVLRDPRDGTVFYVGKGVRDRIHSHQRDASKDPTSERAKLRRINEIERAGLVVELLFLRTGLADGEEALRIEQSVIDAYAATGHPLTNLVKGHDSVEHGLATLPTVMDRYAAKPLPPIVGPVVMFKINRGWRPGMSEEEIYKQTRGHWVVSADVRARAEYALGVAHGVVYGAYRIESWFPSPHPGEEKRWGFVGAAAPELADTIGTQVRDLFAKGGQNPYRKFLEGYRQEADVLSAQG